MGKALSSSYLVNTLLLKKGSVERKKPGMVEGKVFEKARYSPLRFPPLLSLGTRRDVEVA